MTNDRKFHSKSEQRRVTAQTAGMQYAAEKIAAALTEHGAASLGDLLAEYHSTEPIPDASPSDLYAPYDPPNPAITPPRDPKPDMYDLHDPANKVRLIKLIRVHYFGLSLRSAKDMIEAVQAWNRDYYAKTKMVTEKDLFNMVEEATHAMRSVADEMDNVTSKRAKLVLEIYEKLALQGNDTAMDILQRASDMFQYPTVKAKVIQEAKENNHD